MATVKLIQLVTSPPFYRSQENSWLRLVSSLRARFERRSDFSWGSYLVFISVLNQSSSFTRFLMIQITQTKVISTHIPIHYSTCFDTISIFAFPLILVLRNQALSELCGYFSWRRKTCFHSSFVHFFTLCCNFCIYFSRFLKNFLWFHFALSYPWWWD